MATHSSILAWRIPWAKEPSRLQSMGKGGAGPHSVSAPSSASCCLPKRGRPLEATGPPPGCQTGISRAAAATTGSPQTKGGRGGERALGARFWTRWEKARVGWFERRALKHVYDHM